MNESGAICAHALLSVYRKLTHTALKTSRVCVGRSACDSDLSILCVRWIHFWWGRSDMCGGEPQPQRLEFSTYERKISKRFYKIAAIPRMEIRHRNSFPFKDTHHFHYCHAVQVMPQFLIVLYHNTLVSLKASKNHSNTSRLATLSISRAEKTSVCFWRIRRQSCFL